MENLVESFESALSNPKKEAIGFFRESLREFSGAEVSEENMRDLEDMVNSAHSVSVDDNSTSLFWFWLNNDGRVQTAIATFVIEENSGLTVSETSTTMRNVEIKPYKKPEILRRKRVNLLSVEFSGSAIHFIGDNESEIEIRINEVD